jgi:DNA-binding SARP family transcriptional activator
LDGHWQKVGETLAATPLRIYLTGRVCLEVGRVVAEERRFPSRQARLLFASLVCQRAQPVPREQLAEILWPGTLPAAWDPALKSLISKLRLFLGHVNAPSSPSSISSQFGCYQLHLPPNVWIDLEAARHSADEAEGALRSGDIRAAWGPTNVTLAIAQRPFLPGEEGEWVEGKRRELQDLLVRALDCYVEVCLHTGQAALAAQMASQAVSLEPFRETGYRQLMRVHAASGNRAEALRVYQRCRELLADEMGVDPSPETEALYLELLRG